MTRQADSSGEYVEHAWVSTVFGDALVATLGFGHDELAIHLGDVRIQAGFDGDAVEPFDLVALALVVGRGEARARLEQAYLLRVFESFRQQ